MLGAAARRGDGVVDERSVVTVSPAARATMQPFCAPFVRR